MSTALPLPLDTLSQDVATSAHAREAEALRRTVTERLEQHRLRRGVHSAQHALPGMEANSAAAWRTGKPNRVADSVAARFAKSQSYREFLQEEAEAATRQAEAAAEVALRNAEAVAAAQQQLVAEMRSWEAREAAGAVACDTATALPDSAQPKPEAGALLAMLPLAEPLVQPSVLAPSEALRAQVPSAEPKAIVTPEAEAPPAPTISALIALEQSEPLEPTTAIPANLIEFPRQLVAARKARPRLAEGPLREEADREPERAQLRIFEVEASSFSTTPTVESLSALPEWSSIRLDSTTEPHETAQPDAQVSMTLPVYAAPLQRRFMAAAVDGCCIGTAFLLAVAAAAMAGDALPTGLLAAGSAAATLLLFTTGYLLLCFSLSGQTPGMRYARIALCTFGDDNPSRAAMRRRLFSYGLSAVSLGLGFAWALLDDEKLGWHDRISRMYQRAY